MRENLCRQININRAALRQSDTETNAAVANDNVVEVTETNAEVKTEDDDAEFKRKIEIVGISRRLAELKDANAELCEEIHDARDLGEDERHKALVAELHKNNLAIIALSKALRELEAENTNNDDDPDNNPETPDDNNGNKIARFEQGKTYFEIDWSTHGAGKQSVTIERRTAKSVYILGDRYAIREEDGSEYIKFTYDYITTNKFYAKFVEETPGERIMKQFAELPADNADTCNVARYVIFAHSEGGTDNYAIASIDFARAEKALKILKTELPNDEYKFGIDFYPVAFNAAKAIAVYYAAELDGSEDDDGENVFDYLPDVAELNDVDGEPKSYVEGIVAEFTFKPPIDEPETIAAVAAAVAELNAAAPKGWEIFYDAEYHDFTVTFNDKIVTGIDSLAVAKILPPDKFFAQFTPLITRKHEHFIEQRNEEINALEEMRNELTGDEERLRILDELIADNKAAAKAAFLEEMAQ